MASSIPLGTRTEPRTCRSTWCKRRRAGGLELEVEPIQILQPEDRRLRRPDDADAGRRRIGNRPERRAERGRQSVREGPGRRLVLAADDDPGHPLVRRIAVLVSDRDLAGGEGQVIVLSPPARCTDAPA